MVYLDSEQTRALKTFWNQSESHAKSRHLQASKSREQHSNQEKIGKETQASAPPYYQVRKYFLDIWDWLSKSRSEEKRARQ